MFQKPSDTEKTASMKTSRLYQRAKMETTSSSWTRTVPSTNYHATAFLKATTSSRKNSTKPKSNAATVTELILRGRRNYYSRQCYGNVPALSGNVLLSQNPSDSFRYPFKRLIKMTAFIPFKNQFFDIRVIF